MSVSREASPQPTAPAATTTTPGAAPAPTASTSPSSSAVVASNLPLSQMISEMQRAHKHRISQMKDVAESQYKAASASAATACQSLVDISNAEVIDVFNAETRIEQQIKETTSQTEQLHKRMAQWALLFVKFNHALKEIGDVQHWASMVEVDMQETVRILDAVSAKKRNMMGIE